MKKQLGLLTFIVLSMAITSCGCSSQRNNHKSSDNPEPISENHPISQDPIESQNPVPESHDDSSEHQHVFSESWSNDDEYHWHDSICEHELIADKEPHRFNDWQIVIDPTPTSPGLKHHVCSVCDFDKYEDIPATQGSSNPGPNSSSQGPASSSQGGPSSHPGPGGSSQSSSSSQQITQRFTVTWKNYDGVVLEIDYNVEKGAMPSYDFETPVKPSDDEYHYVFTGWTPQVTAVTSNQTYTATFDAVAHSYAKNSDTLEYVCSCGKKNGRDYELNITWSPLHVGDLYVARDENIATFKNDDGTLAYGWIAYQIDEEVINSGVGNDYHFPASLVGMNIVAYIYIGIYDETNIKYEGSDSYTKLSNVDAYINNQPMTKDGRVIHNVWQNNITPRLPTNKFFVYECLVGTLLPAEEQPVFSSDGKTVQYGLYPQTNVDDSALLSALNELTTPESNGWYLYNDEYYAKIVATPYNEEYVFDNGNTILSDTTYWFKCEPIVWNVLSNTNGEYYIVSSILLDAHCYYHSYTEVRTIDGQTVYQNNYQHSDIRAWLNEEFYNSAFSLGNSHVQTTTVDNSAATTDYPSNNSYACDNTEDKVFLPSYKDYTNSSYGFPSTTSASETRCCKTTDWARARGAYYSTNSSYLYNSMYWARSADANYSNNACRIFYDGNVYDDHVDRAQFCVRPAITITE